MSDRPAVVRFEHFCIGGCWLLVLLRPVLLQSNRSWGRHFICSAWVQRCDAYLWRALAVGGLLSSVVIGGHVHSECCACWLRPAGMVVGKIVLGPSCLKCSWDSDAQL